MIEAACLCAASVFAGMWPALDQLAVRADASEVAPRHTAVTRVVILAQADIPLRDLLPALLPRGCAAIGVAICITICGTRTQGGLVDGEGWRGAVLKKRGVN